MLKLAIAVTAVLLSTAAIAQQPQPTTPKPSGQYLLKPGGTTEAFQREMAACRMRAEIAVPLVFDDNIAFQMLSQRRIIADCMRANGWIWTTEATPTNTPPPAVKTPPAAAAVPKSKSPLAAAVPKSDPSSERYYTRTPEASALQKVRNAPNEPTNDPVWRASLADALHRYCESVLMQVPRNTPEQDRWVDSEMKWHAIEGATAFDERYQQQAERLKRVEYSVENARKQLRNMLSRCLSLTKDLVELKQTTPVAEALLWLQLSRYFLSDEIVLRDAKIVGLISPNYCNDEEQHVDDLLFSKWVPPPGAHDENDFCGWNSVLISIIYHAVIPLLEGSGGQ